MVFHDWISYVLNREFSAHPGRHFNYSSGASHLVPFLLGRALGADPAELILEELLFPCGVDRLEWESDPLGNPAGGKGLFLRAHDLLRIGLMVLRGGRLHGRQVVSSEWLSLSTQPKARGSAFYGDYGYQWWLKPGIVAALGFGGQCLFIDRERNLCAVFLGRLNAKEFPEPMNIFERLRQACFQIIDGMGELG